MAGVDVAGQVAIVTGAARGLGKAYAHALADRGATVVVNDLGVDSEGKGRNPVIAQATVDDICAAGGRAVADCSDVADAHAANALIAMVLNEFGRVDIVISNAGICGNRLFSETTLGEFELYWRIHVGGAVNLLKAAWPHLQAQNYGRVVLTESGAGLYGLRGQASYAAAKGAVHGLMRTLALEGRDHNILVNSISPGGFSRMHEAAIEDRETLDWTRKWMPAELVAPAVVWLASRGCKVSGQVYSVWAGRVARVGIGVGPGFHCDQLTPEMLHEYSERVAGREPFFEPEDSLDEVRAWLDGRIKGV